MDKNVVQETQYAGAIARAAQELLHSQNEDYSRQRVGFLHTALGSITADSAMRPEERTMRLARGCRNAVLAGLTFEGGLQTLSRVRDGPIADAAVSTATETAQAVADTNWPASRELGFSPKDCGLLSTIFTQTNNDFEEVAERNPVRPDLTNILLDCDKEVSDTTQAFIDFLNELPEDERTKKDKEHLAWFSGGAPYDYDPFGRARRTNRTTTVTIFNLLLSKQRDHETRLTGPELAVAFRADLNLVAGLSGGRKEFVTYKLRSLVCPYTGEAPTSTDASGYYSNLGPFAKRTHARVPGPCVAYPLLTPSRHDPDRAEKLELIAWHRSMTNNGRLTGDHPAEFMRSSEAALTAGADIVSALWPDSRPFRPNT